MGYYNVPIMRITAPQEPVSKVRNDDREALERAEAMKQAELKTLQALMKEPEEGVRSFFLMCRKCSFVKLADPHESINEIIEQVNFKLSLISYYRMAKT